MLNDVDDYTILLVNKFIQIFFIQIICFCFINFLCLFNFIILLFAKGNLKKAVPFYLSQLIAFNGSDDNAAFPSTQLIIWDDCNKKKLGLIIMKENIIDFRISKSLIYIILPSKILIFELLTLQYIGILEDFDYFCNKLSFCLESTPNLVAYGSSSNKAIIKINKCN